MDLNGLISLTRPVGVAVLPEARRIHLLFHCSYSFPIEAIYFCLSLVIFFFLSWNLVSIWFLDLSFSGGKIKIHGTS
jgi:hypothetical protein